MIFQGVVLVIGCTPSVQREQLSGGVRVIDWMLTVHSDVDGLRGRGPDISRHEVADLTGELRVLVLFGDLVLKLALHRVKPTRLTSHQGDHIDFCEGAEIHCIYTGYHIGKTVKATKNNNGE